MINPDICAMRPGVLENKTYTDTQSPTDSTHLYSFMYLAIFLLRRRVVEFLYRQATWAIKGQPDTTIGRTPLVAMY